jgi:hypothetical protein
MHASDSFPALSPVIEGGTEESAVKAGLFMNGGPVPVDCFYIKGSDPSWLPRRLFKSIVDETRSPLLFFLELSCDFAAIQLCLVMRMIRL